MTNKQPIENVKALSAIEAVLNAHLSGVKRVFVNNDQTESALTQFAYGYMQPGESSGLHKHNTMDEYFYFIKGTGHYVLGDEEISVEPSMFVRVPATVLHNLSQTGNETLEFVYFGIAV